MSEAERPCSSRGGRVPNHGHAYRDRPPGGRCVLDHLAARYARVDRSVWEARLSRGEVALDGSLAIGTEMIRRGQELVWHRPPWVEPEAPLGFAILYSDDAMLAVAKPRGLPVLPGGGLYQEHTLLHQMASRLPDDLADAVPVHRLGTGTSGVVLCARGTDARRSLSDALRQADAVREYLALATGQIDGEHVVMDSPIGPVPHRTLGTVHAVAPDGKPAISRLEVLRRAPGRTWVRVRIETGRSHQIRAHLAALGHPLEGDPLFASGGGFVGGGEAVPTDSGYWLHAARLVVPHPVSGESVEIEAAAPPALRR